MEEAREDVGSRWAGGGEPEPKVRYEAPSELPSGLGFRPGSASELPARTRKSGETGGSAPRVARVVGLTVGQCSDGLCGFMIPG